MNADLTTEDKEKLSRIKNRLTKDYNNLGVIISDFDHLLHFSQDKNKFYSVVMKPHFHILQEAIESIMSTFQIVLRIDFTMTNCQLEDVKLRFEYLEKCFLLLSNFFKKYNHVFNQKNK